MNFFSRESCLSDSIQCLDNLVIVGEKASIRKEIEKWEAISNLLNVKDLSEFLLQVLEKLSPTKEVGAASELWLVGSDGLLRRVALCALPTGCSRHNSPSKPHAISDLIGAHKGDTMPSVLLCLADPRHAFAAGCAVARPFFLFTMKSGGASQELKSDINVYFNDEESALGTNFLLKMKSVADGIRETIRLVDTPANLMHVENMIQEATAVADAVGAQIQIISGEDLRDQGYGGIWSIGKAAEKPPALVILSFSPPASDPSKAIAMVGKGVVYDTGGLSMKTSDGMIGMKCDMGGAAGLLFAFKAAIQLGCTVPLHCLLCLVDNAVSASSVRPDDIVTMFSGKTVEMNNTDCEGRVVLADGVAHAVKFLDPAVIIDMATLTGAQGIATGNKIAALYCNDESLESLAVQVGRFTGDLCHPMPFCPEFHQQQFKSKVADLKNHVQQRFAVVSCAAQFVGYHLGDYLDKGKWLHIDMAYPAVNSERGTGFGVALVSELIQNLQI